MTKLEELLALGEAALWPFSEEIGSVPTEVFDFEGDSLPQREPRKPAADFVPKEASPTEPLPFYGEEGNVWNQFYREDTVTVNNFEADSSQEASPAIFFEGPAAADRTMSFFSEESAMTAVFPTPALGEALETDARALPFPVFDSEVSKDYALTAERIFDVEERQTRGDTHIHNEIPAIHIEFSGSIAADVDVEQLMREMQKRLKEEMAAGTDFYYRC